MITKRILNEERIRSLKMGFSFIPHRFIKGGFLQTLSCEEILLYFFLVLVSDKNGLSFYSYPSICNLVGLDVSEYVEARNNLISKDLICFEDSIYQVLSLPNKPIKRKNKKDEHEKTSVRNIIIQSLKE